MFIGFKIETKAALPELELGAWAYQQSVAG